MMAYAVKFNINDIFIFYPNRLSSNDTNPPDIEINANNRIINISAHKLPIAFMEGNTYIAGEVLKERLMNIFYLCSRHCSTTAILAHRAFDTP